VVKQSAVRSPEPDPAPVIFEQHGRFGGGLFGGELSVVVQRAAFVIFDELIARADPDAPFGRGGEAGGNRAQGQQRLETAAAKYADVSILGKPESPALIPRERTDITFRRAG